MIDHDAIQAATRDGYSFDWMPGRQLLCRNVSPASTTQRFAHSETNCRSGNNLQLRQRQTCPWLDVGCGPLDHSPDALAVEAWRASEGVCLHTLMCNSTDPRWSLTRKRRSLGSVLRWRVRL